MVCLAGLPSVMEDMDLHGTNLTWPRRAFGGAVEDQH